MKLAWLCYKEKEDYEGLGRLPGKPVILFFEPDEYEYYMVVPIVYAELVK